MSSAGANAITRLALTALGVALIFALTAAPAAGPAAAAPAARPGSAAPLYLWAAGRDAVAFPLSPELLKDLSKGVAATSSRALPLHPDLNGAPADTIALPKPLITAPLPKGATQILLPEGKDSRTLVLTRAGIVPLDVAHPEQTGDLLLSGQDIAQGARAADGTIYLLERAYDERLRVALPSLLLAWTGASAPPDTATLCTKGSLGLVLAPGDSVIWVTRRKGRAVDRLSRQEGGWSRREVQLVPPVPVDEERWGIGSAFADPPRRSIFVSQARGMDPDLLEVLADGSTRTLYTWRTGLSCVNGVLASQRRLLILNGTTMMSVLDLETLREWNVAVSRPVTAVAATPDADWVATASLTADRSATIVELRRRGSARTATARIEGMVSALAIQVGSRPDPAR